MNKKLHRVIKLLFILCITLISLLYIAPNFSNRFESTVFNKKFNLGLDLQGGAQILLEVDIDRYLTDEYYSFTEEIKKYIKQNKYNYNKVISDLTGITFSFQQNIDIKVVKNLLSKKYPYTTIDVLNDKIKISYNKIYLQEIVHNTLEQSIEIIRKRVDESGTKEISIQIQGNNQILLQIPGIVNPEEIKNQIGQVAKLGFHLVDEKLTNDLLEGKKTLTSKMMLVSNDKEQIVVHRRMLLSGDMLKNALLDQRDLSPKVMLSFNSLGTKKFANITTRYKNKRLAIILDNKLLSAPMINDAILTGEAVISGNFTIDEAHNLSMLLRAGSLPAPLKIVEEQIVGPTLGVDSIESGKKAGFVGFILVVVFMIMAYGVFGLIANIALVVALILLLMLVNLLELTLTFPGIAGIILTIGMAVDANVLIYERIKEELKKKVSVYSSVKIGFKSAFGTILDSNITTLIAAILLYIYGIGFIKGFAVTLSVGIIVSMFSSLVVTKVLIDNWIHLSFIDKKLANNSEYKIL